MLELTAGRVVTMYDTPMGFRHGPKSIVDDTTLTVVYLSDEAYTRQYEVDLLKEMSGQRKGNKIVVVMSSADEAVSALADYTVVYDMKEENETFFLDWIISCLHRHWQFLNHFHLISHRIIRVRQVK